MCCLGAGLLVLTSCGALFVVSGVVGASTITPDDEQANASSGDATADEWQSFTTSSSRPTSLTLSARPSRAIRASPAHRPTLAVVPEASSFSINDPAAADDHVLPRSQSALDEVLLQAQSETHLHSRDEAHLLGTGRFRSYALGLLALLSQVWVWFGLTTVFQGLCNGGLTVGCPDIWQQISYIATGHFIVAASGAFISPPGDDVLKSEKHGMSPLVQLYLPLCQRGFTLWCACPNDGDWSCMNTIEQLKAHRRRTVILCLRCCIALFGAVMHNSGFYTLVDSHVFPSAWGGCSTECVINMHALQILTCVVVPLKRAWPTPMRVRCSGSAPRTSAIDCEGRNIGV